MTDTVAKARAALDSGRASSRALVDAALDRIADPAGEGARTFTRVYPAAARAAADAFDGLHRAGVAAVSPLAGLPVSVKDLFDVAGETTTAGAAVRAEAHPAARDARIVARLRRAGAAIVGKTTMTEFAFHGLGLNPHHGTPRNAYGRIGQGAAGEGLIPGGSSSGAAVSVTDGMAVVAVGTDTGGSVRVPAAMNGLVGFKPTARRVPQEGCFPLSTQLDSIGPLGRTVACCVALDRVLAGHDPEDGEPAALPAATLSLFVPTNYLFDEVAPDVARAFDRALARLRDAGVRVVEGPLPSIEIMRELVGYGGFSSAESWAKLKHHVLEESHRMDPLVVARVRRGETITAADWIAMTEGRRAFIRETWAACAGFTAIACPTSPVTAPRIADMEADLDLRGRQNMLILRNTMVGNWLDACAVTIPCHAPGDAPVGFMMTAPGGRDDHLLGAALTVESLIAAQAGSTR
ncbi:MAG TPA: amidase [Azospirillaceae bacterium]|nr:amidase [Azospirillaceae bacterium]